MAKNKDDEKYLKYEDFDITERLQMLLAKPRKKKKKDSRRK